MDPQQRMYFLILLAALTVYMLPWFVATYRHHHQTGAIAVLNMLLGWTFLGVVVALACASTAVREPSSRQTRPEA